MLADSPGPAEDLAVEARLHRVGIAHDVTVDVAAASDGIDEGSVDALNDPFDIPLQDAMVLKSLTAGQTQGAVGQGVADLIHDQPLLRRADATGQARSGSSWPTLLRTSLDQDSASSS